MEPPRLVVAAVECVAALEPVQHPGDAARWYVTWQVDNAGRSPVALRAAWIPHGRFRGDGRLPLGEHLEPDTSARLRFSVFAVEAPGTVVENAFLILRVDQEGQSWRVFTRMRIEFDGHGVPAPVVETVTTQALSQSLE